MSLKELTEKKAEVSEKMSELLNKIKLEKRAFTEEELKIWDELKNQAAILNSTIEALEIAREEKLVEEENRKEEGEEMGSQERSSSSSKNKTKETRSFANFIRGVAERSYISLGDNGAIIPETISKNIIENVRNLCPVYEKAEIFNVKGKLEIPCYGMDGNDITCNYCTEPNALTSTAGEFTTIELSGFTAGALTKISRSLINNTEIDITQFVVKRMSEAISVFIENQFLNGTGTSACQGILTGATNITETSLAGTIKADDLIDLQESVKDLYQRNAVWIMNPATRAAIRKFKDTNGQYLLNQDLNAQWGYTLLGKPVYCSDNMPVIADGSKSVIYGDLSGLSVKFAETMELEILRELYAETHLIGVIGWIEVDSRVTNQQKLAVLQVASA